MDGEGNVGRERNLVEEAEDQLLSNQSIKHILWWMELQLSSPIR